jgi:hypothetical protein
MGRPNAATGVRREPLAPHWAAYRISWLNVPRVSVSGGPTGAGEQSGVLAGISRDVCGSGSSWGPRSGRCTSSRTRREALYGRRVTCIPGVQQETESKRHAHGGVGELFAHRPLAAAWRDRSRHERANGVASVLRGDRLGIPFHFQPRHRSEWRQPNGQFAPRTHKKAIQPPPKSRQIHFPSLLPKLLSLYFERNPLGANQGLIGLIGYSYQQGIPSFPEAHLKKNSRLSVLGLERFDDG